MLKNLFFLCIFTITTSAYAQKVGEPAPLFSGVDQKGQTIALEKYKGKVVVIDFWASWCAPCKEEMKTLNSLHKKLGKKGLVMIGVGIDRERKAFESFIKQNPVDFTLTHDPKHQIVKKYSPPKMPTSYVVDKKGTIRFIHKGFNAQKDPESLEKEAIKLLESK